MTETTPAETPTTDLVFSLALLPSWEELDIRPATRDRSISFVIGERIKAVPQLAPRRSELVAYLRDLARTAWDAGTRFCAVFIEGNEDGLLPCSLTVSILPPALANGGNPTDAIIDQLNGLEQPTGVDHWSQTTMVTLKHAGRAVRSYGVEPIQVPGTTQPPIPMVLMHTYIPFDGGVALITCGSPAATAAEPLLELFDIVTDNFRLHSLGQE